MQKIVHYTIVKSEIVGDAYDDATFEVRPYPDGYFFISGTPTRGGNRGSSILMGQINELRFPTVQSATEWLEAQPAFGKQQWFTKKVE